MSNHREALGDLNQIKVSEHYYLSDFECKGRLCCGYSVKVYRSLIDAVEEIWDAVNVQAPPSGMEIRIKLISAYRCPRHNKEVGGVFHSLSPIDSKNSFHCAGLAADPVAVGLSKHRLAHIARKVTLSSATPFRVGYYSSESAERLHIDTADFQQLGLPQIFGDLWDD